MDELVFNVAVEKGACGFGIYFIGNESGRVIVEGFVPAQDGTAGPAELLGCIQPDDVLEKINGVDITTFHVAQVIETLRNAPIGLNGLTFRRHQEHQELEKDDVLVVPMTNKLFGGLKKTKESNVKSPLWWSEFHRLKALDVHRWETAHVTEAEFCDLLYNACDDQQKSYLRHEFPTLMQHHQEQFQVWPQPLQSCQMTAYTSNLRHTEPTVIEPTPCLATLLDVLRLRFGWTRQEITAFITALQSQYDIHSAIDFLSCRRQKKILQLPASFPRLTQPIWQAIDEAAMGIVSKEDLRHIESLAPF